MLLALPGLVAFQVAQSGRARVPGWIGTVLLVLGIAMLEIPHLVKGLFDPSSLYDLDAYHASTFGQMEFYGIVTLALGMIVLAVATWRSGFYPRAAVWLLVANIVVSAVGSSVPAVADAVHQPAPSLPADGPARPGDAAAAGAREHGSRPDPEANQRQARSSEAMLVPMQPTAHVTLGDALRLVSVLVWVGSGALLLLRARPTRMTVLAGCTLLANGISNPLVSATEGTTAASAGPDGAGGGADPGRADRRDPSRRAVPATVAALARRRLRRLAGLRRGHRPPRDGARRGGRGGVLRRASGSPWWPRSGGTGGSRIP